MMPDERPPFEAAVAAPSRYFVGNQTLGESLRQVAELTIQALPQTDHVGITLLVEGRLKTSVFTHPEVPEIDQAQYRTGDGPCVDAYREDVPHLIESTLVPGRWQPFRDSAARHGVFCTLSLPLITHDGPIGALNMYAETEHAYDEADQQTASLFATQAAFLLANAQEYWDARTLSETLSRRWSRGPRSNRPKGSSCAPWGAVRTRRSRYWSAIRNTRTSSCATSPPSS
jgi:GAF domain-containing protein